MAIHFHKLFSPNAKKTDHANYRYVQYDVRKQFAINSSSVFHSFCISFANAFVKHSNATSRHKMFADILRTLFANSVRELFICE